MSYSPAPPSWYRPRPWRRWPVLRQMFQAHWQPLLKQGVRMNDVALVKKSLNAGANPNGHLPGEVQGSFVPVSLLHFAVEQGFHQCVEALVQAGAQLEVKGKGLFDTTPLAQAILKGDYQCARVLALAGASFECKLVVLDPTTLADACSMGGLDPRRIGNVQTTLAQLVSGEKVSLRHSTAAQVNGRPDLSDDPKLHHLLRELEAVKKEQHLAEVWKEPEVTSEEPAEPVAAPKRRARL